LSAPFCSRGFRRIFLPALARFLAARKCSVSVAGRDGATCASRSERSRSKHGAEKHNVEKYSIEKHSIETSFVQKHDVEANFVEKHACL
jgi:hypothetical protein